jgi:hypothetical protein
MFSEPQMRCAHCRQSISRNAIICPWCHLETKTSYAAFFRKRWLFILVVLIPVMLVVVLDGPSSSKPIRTSRDLHISSSESHATLPHSQALQTPQPTVISAGNVLAIDASLAGRPPTSMHAADGQLSSVELIYSSAGLDVYIPQDDLFGLISARPTEDWEHSRFEILLLKDYKSNYDCAKLTLDRAEKEMLSELSCRFVEETSTIDTRIASLTVLRQKFIDDSGDIVGKPVELKAAYDLTDESNDIQREVASRLVHEMADRQKMALDMIGVHR